MEGKWVVENALEPIDMTKIRRVAPVMNNHTDRLALLQAAQHSCDAAR